MKFVLTCIFSIFSLIFFSQKKLPLIKSNSAQVKIIENKEIITNWNLNPKAKPDIYTTGKNLKYRTVKMVTDIDSLEIKLKPKQKFDFIVLLKGRDSCLTRFESPEIKNFSKVFPVKHDTIPFVLTKYNNIQVDGILNKKDTIKLMFDTGSTDFYLLKSAIKKYLNPDNKKLTMKDIRDNDFKIGNLDWNHQQIYPIESTGQYCAGVFGWNMFDGKIVEVDYDRNIIIVHTKMPKISKDYEKFEMEMMKEHFCINVVIENNKQKFKSRFLFDSGFQKNIMLDNNLLKKANYPEDQLKIISETIMHNSNNDPIPLKVFNNEKLIFGKYVLENVPAQINSTTKPTGYDTNFLGNEVLKRFNTILDFQNDVVYLKPNHFFNDNYSEDLKKS